MLEEIPYFRLSEAMPDAVARLLGSLPVLKPVIPDPGIALPARARGRRGARVRGRRARRSGEPGPYNLAGSGTLTMSDVADALGWYSVPVPKQLVDATAEVATRLPFMPETVAWIHSVRKPVLMKTDRARKLLRWKPKHTARATLKEMCRTLRGAAAPAVQLRVVLLGHLARVEQRRAVAHRALHERRDPVLGHADLATAAWAAPAAR